MTDRSLSVRFSRLQRVVSSRLQQVIPARLHRVLSSRQLTIVALVCVVLVGVIVAIAMGGLLPTGGEDRSTKGESASAASDRNTSTTATDLPCAVGDLDGAAGDQGAIVELYPNPTTHRNVGEYLVVETPPETSLANWTITDGHTTAGFPNETVSGRVAVSTDPAETAAIADEPIVELEGTLRLAVDGDELTLRNGSAIVDRVTYERAPVAEHWSREQSADPVDAADDAPATGQWWPRDATCRPTATIETEGATAFVLPDSPEVPAETIEGADDRLLVSGYTFTDPDSTDALVDARERGVDVDVLLESGPVGGTPEATRSELDRLIDAGVDVRVLGGEGARYRFHHPKYLVADNTVIVMSENWKPTGVGGESSRGWGVRVSDAAVATELAAVFRADFDGWDTTSGTAYLEETSFVEDDQPPPREFESAHDPDSVSIDAVELLLAPDNAEPRLQELIDSADDELLVKQASVNPDVSVLQSTIDAAQRGVSVRLLLDSSWYVADDHERLKADLERTATADDLDLAVRLVEDTDAFEKIHAKGIVVDREVAVVGSANWNPTSLQENREVLLALYGPEVGAYYAAVFESDWAGDRWSVPIGLSVTVVVVLCGAALVGRRYIRFGDEQVDGQ